jgi:hypothetical protein
LRTLRERGIDLVAADNPGSFLDDTPTAKPGPVAPIEPRDQDPVASLGASRAPRGRGGERRYAAARRVCRSSWLFERTTFAEEWLASDF